MPIGTQARLLRVLETGEFFKVGSSQPQKTDVRVVAATNKNLVKDIQRGKFREDLYYRLCTVQIDMPALRDRGVDIELLFRKFASDFAEKNRTNLVRLTPEATEMLKRNNWPGNVRQLKNVAEQCALLSDREELNTDELARFLPNVKNYNLPQLVDGSSSQDNFSEREILYKIMFDLKNDMNELKQFVLQMAKSNNFSTDAIQHVGDTSNERMEQLPQSYNVQTHSLPQDQHEPYIIHDKDKFNDTEEIEETLSLADMEKMMIIKSLEKYNGKRKNAADELGISERTLYRKIKEYDIDL